MRLQLILILVITALLLSACGTKGPVRPIAKVAVEQPAAAPQADVKKNSN